MRLGSAEGLQYGRSLLDHVMKKCTGVKHVMMHVLFSHVSLVCLCSPDRITTAQLISFNENHKLLCCHELRGRVDEKKINKHVDKIRTLLTCFLTIKAEVVLGEPVITTCNIFFFWTIFLIEKRLFTYTVAHTFAAFACVVLQLSE